MKNIFISSTFRDMQDERDMLQETVLPELKAEARKYGENVNMIDLRWGVDTSELETDEGAAKVLSVCLDEIDKCHPYMLIFVGERYGWIPDVRMIESAVKRKNRDFVLNDYEKSVTALEIEYGALSEIYGDLEHCIVCFREPLEVNGMDEGQYSIYRAENAYAKEKLDALKEKLKQQVGDRIIYYSGTWDENKNRITDFITANGAKLADVIIQKYIELFKEEWEKYEKLEWEAKEQLHFKGILENKINRFGGREALLYQYYAKCVGMSGIMVLQGDAGCGKTSIMCKLIDMLQKENKHVFYFFTGTSMSSKNAMDLVYQVLYYMENLLQIDFRYKEVAENIQNAMYLKIDWANKREKEKYEKNWLVQKKEIAEADYWKGWFERYYDKVTEEGPIYVFIDRIDLLYQGKAKENLDFLLDKEKIRFIVSCGTEFSVDDWGKDKVLVEQIPLLEKIEVLEVSEGILSAYSKNTYVSIINEMLLKKGISNPLYISFLLQRLNMMDYEDLYCAKTEEEIVEQGCKLIRHMPHTIEEAATSIIEEAVERIQPEDNGLTEVIRLIAVSEYGLSPKDIEMIAAENKINYNQLNFIRLTNYLDGFFVQRDDERIDFAYEIIRKEIRKGIKTNDEIFYEEAILKRIKALSSEVSLRACEGMYFARKRKDYQFAGELIADAACYGSLELAYAIQENVMVDEGAFLCGFIRKELFGLPYNVKNRIIGFFEKYFSLMFEVTEQELKAQWNVFDALLQGFERNGYADEDKYVCCNYLRNILLEQGKTQNVIEYSVRCVALGEHIKKDKTRLIQIRDICLDTGMFMLEEERYEEAIVYYKKYIEYAKEHYGRSKDCEELSNLTAGYSNVNYVLQKLEKYEEALDYCRKAMESAESYYCANHNVRALFELSICYHDFGRVLAKLGRKQEAIENYIVSIKQLENAYQENQQDIFLEKLLNRCNEVGGILEEVGRDEEALSYYREFMSYAEQFYRMKQNVSGQFQLAVANNRIGSLLRKCEKVGEAVCYLVKAYESAKEIYQENESITNLRFYVVSARLAAVAYSDVKDLDDALKYAKEAVKYCLDLCSNSKKNGDVEISAKVYTTLGDLYFLRNEYMESVTAYQKAHEEYEMLNDIGMCEEIEEKIMCALERI